MRTNFKILALCPIDLSIGGGATPMFWQLFMRLAESGTEVIVIPPVGRVVASPWWHGYQNPVPNLSFHNLMTNLYDKLSRPYVMKLHHEYTVDNPKHDYKKTSPFASSLKDFKDRCFSVSYKEYWTKCLEKVWKKEKMIDAVFLFSDNLNYMKWLPRHVHKYHEVPIAVYNADLPTYLWNERSYRYSPFYNVNFGDYDALIVNSEGVVDKLRKMGVSKVYVLHFGADPDLFSPIPVEKDVDVSFYGYGSDLREEALTSMITAPSKKLEGVHFRTAGSFKLDLGLSKHVGSLNFASMKKFCCRSRINLNITRKTFAETYCSSTSRPFELAAMQSCIVSNPCRGMTKWFEPGKEILEVHDEKEASELYEWLLSHDDFREQMGKNAWKKLCEKHTYKHRAREFIGIVKSICG
jgi:glycosyltransferase involved in cell wall biosynthesis